MKNRRIMDNMKNLKCIFNPKGVAVIGASNEESTVGYGLFRNLTTGLGSEVFPVNPNRKNVQSAQAYSSVKDINKKVDLAVIAVPAKIVPKVIKECGEKGIKGCIVISSGFKEVGEKGKVLEDEIKELIDKYNITLIGPNCLGVINTKNNLNASFSSHMPKEGRTAVLSQSGALGSAIIEWSLEQGIGINSFVSVGSMLDVDFGDLLHYFTEDTKTDGIIIYMESIKNARKFMDAARKCIKKKPIVVLKAGSTDAGRNAAISHTGSLAGNEDIYTAAFRQTGILQIDEISDVFSCLRTLNSSRLPKGSKLAIVTNAGGAGVLAVDAVQKRGGEIANLSKETIKRLNKELPSAWSKSNPVDILGDASAATYKEAIETCVKDKNVDGVLVIFTPQYSSEPEKTAEAVSEVSKQYDKPIISSWIGPKGMDKASEILSKKGVPNYPTPEKAVKAFINMVKYRTNLELLKEIPPKIPRTIKPDRKWIKEEIDKSRNNILSEVKSKQILLKYEIPVVETKFAKTPEEAANKAADMGFPVALKVQSPDITHKSDVGGVVLYLHSRQEVMEGFKKICENVKKHKPKISIEGTSVQKMVDKIDYELILGSKKDPDFGAIVLFGRGGSEVEIYNDKAIGLPPLNGLLAGRVMEHTKIFKFLKKGYRNKKPADIKSLKGILERFSYLILDFPEIKEVDINPLAIKDGKPLVLDARMVIKTKFGEKNIQKR